MRIGTVGHGTQPTRKLPAIKEQSLSDAMAFFVLQGRVEPTLKAYKLGGCHILLAAPHGDFGWHLSISHRHRYPTWDEIAKARYSLIPDDVTMIMVLPPEGEYVSISQNCFHLWEEGKLRSTL